jgi:glucokinase
MFISIDIGGTNTRVASSKDLVSLHKVERFKSSNDLNAEKKLLKQAILAVAADSKIDFISLGVPGVVDKTAQVFTKVPSYPDLNDKPFNFLIDAYFRNVPMVVENDAALAGLAESMMGAGKDFKSVSYLTLSTGVGGVHIDKPLKDFKPKAYEPGHQIIIQNGRYNDRCGQFGCLEAYVSGSSFEQVYKVKPENCADEIVWDDFSRHLASGIINVLAMWNPEVIVFGGKVSNKFGIFQPKLLSYLKKQRFFKLPALVQSEFMDDAGLYGGFINIGLMLQEFKR